ncbi:hypothetical protein [Fimbriiglobus ruber]|uniref:Uncharacterized protein n=1 Tax=Fimbriiglobus ruber TaxID=1908690 RepID=A0A225DSD8_9BACT|nr:hypothetical protein [Fimbriiglobus ruber]OWK44380.1 hypothetical protein FRUB_02312 [Fimbriiglobus ruber]
MTAFPLCAPVAAAQNKIAPPYFGIHVVDEKTGRGVPLAELRTVNDVSYYTDSAGWVAFHEPGLMGREVYFGVESAGYECAKDGFGFRGTRLTPKAGTTAVIKVTRTNVAERLYRITGQGVYRDSSLLGLPVPITEPNLNAGVLGQDSVQAVPYRGRLFWLWGDTNLPDYPLGNFHTTAATSPLPGTDGVRPGVGIDLTYFTDPARPDRVRKMVPMTEPGVVWLFGLLTVTDESGQDSLVAHFSRRKSLAEETEHGLVRFDDAAGVFKKIKTFDRDNKWRFPRENAIRVRGTDGDYFYFASPFCHTRVKAVWGDILDPSHYEALEVDPETGTYRWQRERPPTTQTEESRLVKAGRLAKENARYQIDDAKTGTPVTFHRASITWNEYRKRWVMIGTQQGGKGAPSYLGEVWYAEADDVAGPWGKAVKVATHPNYSFYNPRHHTFFDEDGGKTIYFEGTYTKSFTSNPIATPRYEYNQLLYRLDLDDERLKAAR